MAERQQASRPASPRACACKEAAAAAGVGRNAQRACACEPPRARACEEAAALAGGPSENVPSAYSHQAATRISNGSAITRLHAGLAAALCLHPLPGMLCRALLVGPIICLRFRLPSLTFCATWCVIHQCDNNTTTNASSKAESTDDQMAGCTSRRELTGFSMV